MNYEERREQRDRDDQYHGIKARKKQVKKQLQNWVNDATALLASSPEAEKTEIIAIRDQLAVDLKAILGV